MGSAVQISRSDRQVCTWCESELARLGKKRCRTCSEALPIATAFHKNTRHCRICTSKRLAAAYAKKRNEQEGQARVVARREANGAAQRLRYAANPEKYKAAQRAYYMRNRERLQEVARRNHAANREERMRRNAAWHRANPDAGRRYWHNRKLKILRQIRGQV